MAALRDVIGYLCTRYRLRRAVSKARLTRLVYLADWRSALVRDRQMTDIAWYYDHFGPNTDVVWKTVYEDEHFNIDDRGRGTSDLKVSISVKKPFDFVSLSDDKEILNHVVRTTAKLPWPEFMKLVYSTFPILAGRKYETLNLVVLAQQYSQQLQKAAVVPRPSRYG